MDICIDQYMHIFIARIVLSAMISIAVDILSYYLTRRISSTGDGNINKKGAWLEKQNV